MVINHRHSSLRERIHNLVDVGRRASQTNLAREIQVISPFTKSFSIPFETPILETVFL